ncbi:hypothetical protein ACFYXJ_06475 [Streptomyces sp. NPDC002667]
MNSENVVLTRVHLETAPDTIVLAAAGAASAVAPRPAGEPVSEPTQN